MAKEWKTWKQWFRAGVLDARRGAKIAYPNQPDYMLGYNSEKRGI